MPHLVLVDRTRVLQLLNNLLTNAFKFTDKGSILTSVWFERIAGMLDYLLWVPSLLT